jgi:hypothetical protein
MHSIASAASCHQDFEFLVDVDGWIRQAVKRVGYLDIAISSLGHTCYRIANRCKLLRFGCLSLSRLIDLILGLDYRGAKFLG